MGWDEAVGRANLEHLNHVVDTGMTLEERDALLNHLIGGLSGHVDAATWKQLVEAAAADANRSNGAFPGARSQV